MAVMPNVKFVHSRNGSLNNDHELTFGLFKAHSVLHLYGEMLGHFLNLC